MNRPRLLTRPYRTDGRVYSQRNEMKQIETYLNLITPPSCEDSPQECKMNDKILTRLFAVLSAQYLQKWTSLIQNDDAENAMRKVWGDILFAVDPIDIKTALDRLPVEYPDWPPTAGQFLALCKVGKDPSMRPALPKPRGDETIALDALAEISKILRQ